jgi:hypothetical protein
MVITETERDPWAREPGRGEVRAVAANGTGPRGPGALGRSREADGKGWPRGGPAPSQPQEAPGSGTAKGERQT